MSDARDAHDLLPAFVAGSLEESAAERFREHLASCLVCKGELAFMERVRDGAAEHGDAFFADHPSVDDIVATATGEDVGVTGADVLRHLEICATCSTEVAWVRGEATAGRDRAPDIAPHRAPAVPPRGTWWGWMTAAAAVLALAVSLTLRPGSPETMTLPVTQGFVQPAERSGDVANRIVVAADSKAVVLLVYVDIPTDAFPATIELLDSESVAHALQTIASRDILTEGFFFPIECGVKRCPAGKYVVRITGGSAVERVLPVELVDATD